MVGETATLHAPATILKPPATSRETITWRSPAGSDIQHGGRFNIKEGGAKLSIKNCELIDSGEYICTAKSSIEQSLSGVNPNTRTVRLVLEVSRLPVPPSQPKVQDLKGTSAVITWEAGAGTGTGAEDRMVRVEACRLAIGNILNYLITQDFDSLIRNYFL